MGRPKSGTSSQTSKTSTTSTKTNSTKPKTEEVKKQDVVETKEIDVKSLIAQVTDEVSNKVKNEYEGILNELKLQLENKDKEITEAKQTKKKYKFIPDNTKIRIKSNVDGMFIYSEDRGKVKVFVEIKNHQETVVLNYDELRVLSTKPYFKRGTLAIIDVYSDGDIELEDLLKDLRLDNIYLDESKVDPMDLETLFTNEVSVKDFEKKIKNSSDMAEAILDTAYVLYKQGTFNDNAKMNYLRQIFRNTELFK